MALCLDGAYPDARPSLASSKLEATSPPRGAEVSLRVTPFSWELIISSGFDATHRLGNERL